MNNFGKRLKNLLSENEISIKEFAKRVGLSEIGLHNAIKSNSTKLETLERIAVALSVPVSFFIKTEDELIIERQAKEKENLLKALNDEYLSQIQTLSRDERESEEKIMDFMKIVSNAIMNGVPLDDFLEESKSSRNKHITAKVGQDIYKELMEEIEIRKIEEMEEIQKKRFFRKKN